MKVVRITTTAELVAAVPWMLGYHPSAGGEAMVALTDDGPCVGCGVGGPLLVEMLPDHSYLLLVLYGRHADPGPLGAVAHDIARVVGGYVQINEGDWTELPDMSSMGWNLPPTLAEPAASREEMVASLMPEPCADLCDGVIGDLQALTVAAAADLLPDMVTRAAANKNLAAAVAYLLGVEPLFHHVVAWAGADSDRVNALIGVYRAAPDELNRQAGIAACYAAWLSSQPGLSNMLAAGFGEQLPFPLQGEPGRRHHGSYQDLARKALTDHGTQLVGSLLPR